MITNRTIFYIYIFILDKTKRKVKDKVGDPSEKKRATKIRNKTKRIAKCDEFQPKIIQKQLFPIKWLKIHIRISVIRNTFTCTQKQFVRKSEKPSAPLLYLHILGVQTHTQRIQFHSLPLYLPCSFWFSLFDKPMCMWPKFISFVL